MFPIFTKTWVNDLPWLQLAATSLARMCMEPCEWKIVIEDEHFDNLLATLEGAPQKSDLLHVSAYRLSKDWPESLEISNGYLRQQWVKMNAHRLMGMGAFWNWDSDLLAVKKLSQASFMGHGNRPVYWFTPINDIMDQSNRHIFESRAAVLREIFGLREVAFEWMRCMPMPGIGEILRCGAERKEWAAALNMCKRGVGGFSEFNVIGEFAHLYFPDAFEWRNTRNFPNTWAGEPNDKHAIVSQRWSWGGIPEDLKKFVAAL